MTTIIPTDHKMRLLYTFFSYLLLLLLLPSSSHLCNPDDKKILLQIKKAFHNPYALSSWNPNTDCCHWYSLQCDPTPPHRRTSLTILTSTSISGTIPPQVGHLPFLQSLHLHKLPYLHGTIPSSISNLKNIQTLRISYTNIYGTIPSFISTLKSLTFLDLSFNNLSGNIPPSLSYLPSLSSLHLDRNRLTGAIPDSFGRFRGRVPDLYLSHNLLSGTIPSSLGKLKFDTIDFSRNMLEGDASMFFGLNKTMFMMDLSRNMLEFDMSELEIPEKLQYLDLNHNMIRGGIPVGLIADSNLQFLNLSYNKLCGRIPEGGKLQSFDYSSYFHNKCLCGSPLSNCTS